MATRLLLARAFLPAAGGILLACVVCGPASAGNNSRVVPLCGDDRGNEAWVEIESGEGRTTAKPYVAVGGKGLRKALENPNENGALAIPVPGLMRMIERARHALQGMKRSGAQEPPAPEAPRAAAPRAEAPSLVPRDAARCAALSLGPPDRTGTAICPPPALFSSASR